MILQNSFFLKTKKKFNNTKKVDCSNQLFLLSINYKLFIFDKINNIYYTVIEVLIC